MSASEATNDEFRARAARVRARFTAEGVNISEWARQRSFNGRLVHAVLNGDRPCLRGQSHRIAIALGIKDEPAAPSAPAGADRLEGFTA